MTALRLGTTFAVVTIALVTGLAQSPLPDRGWVVMACLATLLFAPRALLVVQHGASSPIRLAGTDGLLQTLTLWMSLAVAATRAYFVLRS